MTEITPPKYPLVIDFGFGYYPADIITELTPYCTRHVFRWKNSERGLRYVVIDAPRWSDPKEIEDIARRLYGYVPPPKLNWWQRFWRALTFRRRAERIA